LEHRNVPEDVAAELLKLQSIGLCSNLPGQLAVDVMVAPPKPGEASHPTWVAERDGILADLAAKAGILGRAVNAIPGMSVQPPRGAMYAFVRFELPPEPGVDVAAMAPALRAAHEAKRDSAYCLALLEETGICVVPGSGFGQEPGTLHFRTTFLPPRDEIESLVDRLRAFHVAYVQRLHAAKPSPA
jgi:aspartate/methionine/tyrosine aminotransferase